MARQLRVGVQFGLGYLPLYVAKDAGFFEKRLRDEGLDSIPVEFSHLAGGPQVNDGLLSQSLEIGSGGYTAMMVYCEKRATPATPSSSVWPRCGPCLTSSSRSIPS
jgi:ABC-type nitrate/sulfonate/bicarbonate transport system substrate-binding protein